MCLKCSRYLIRSQKWQSKLHIIDINFKDLVKQPEDTLRSIYEHFGLAVPVNLAKSIQDYLATHPKDEYGIHEYSLERYGLDRAELYKTYEPYIKQFNVALES